MTVKSGLDLVLALLYAPGLDDEPAEEIRGITRLEKLVFLAVEEGGFGSRTPDLRYQAYDFGPYSKEVVDYVAALEGLGLVKAREVKFESFKEVVDRVMATGEFPTEEKAGTVEIYELTEKGRQVGRRVFDRLTQEEQRRVAGLKRRYNRMDLSSLLNHVYRNYPEMTKKSKILDEILGLGARMGLKVPPGED